MLQLFQHLSPGHRLTVAQAEFYNAAVDRRNANLAASRQHAEDMKAAAARKVEYETAAGSVSKLYPRRV
jgi:hypothetical protein